MSQVVSSGMGVVTQITTVLIKVSFLFVDPSARAVYGEGLRPTACWDCGSEFYLMHGCMFFVSVVR